MWERPSTTAFAPSLSGLGFSLTVVVVVVVVLAAAARVILKVTDPEAKSAPEGPTALRVKVWAFTSLASADVPLSLRLRPSLPAVASLESSAGMTSL